MEVNKLTFYELVLFLLALVYNGSKGITSDYIRMLQSISRSRNIVTPIGSSNNYPVYSVPTNFPQPQVNTLPTPIFVPQVSKPPNNEPDIYVLPITESPKIVVPSTTGAFPLPPVTGTVVVPNPPTITSSGKASQKCQEYTRRTRKREITPYVIGGINTQFAEFPHMAALGFGDAAHIQWLCGGSLISENFVVTAAHCLITPELGAVSWVRLGDTNLFSPADDANVQQFSVMQRISHPSYIPPSLYNDIALLQLDRAATFTTFVRPVCLYTSMDLSNAPLVATGWGKTQFGGNVSDHLLKVTLDLYGNVQCRQTYAAVSPAQLGNGIVDSMQICAGSPTIPRDTCEGDSGGPLHIKREIMYLAGITSFGIACGIPNTPAVYTRVSNYLAWLETIVWPN